MKELRIKYLNYRESQWDLEQNTTLTFETYIKLYNTDLEIIKKIMNGYFKSKENMEKYTLKMLLDCFNYYGFEVIIEKTYMLRDIANVVLNNMEDYEVEPRLLESDKILNLRLICMKKTCLVCKENDIPKEKILLRNFEINASNKFQACIKVKKNGELKNNKIYFMIQKIFSNTNGTNKTFSALKTIMSENYNCEFVFSNINDKYNDGHKKLIEHSYAFKIKPTLIDSPSEATLIIDFICDKRRKYDWL